MLVSADLSSPTRRASDLLLARIKETNNAVVVAGDMNTSTHDGTPLSLKRAIKNRLGSKRFWARQALEMLTGTKLPTLLLTGDRKSTRLNSSHVVISYAVF